jgi:hypothetical protein
VAGILHAWIFAMTQPSAELILARQYDELYLWWD